MIYWINITRFLIYLYRRYKTVIFVLLMLIVALSFFSCNKIAESKENQFRNIIITQILEKDPDTNWEYLDYYSNHPSELMTDFIVCGISIAKNGDKTETEPIKACSKFEKAEEDTLEGVSIAVQFIVEDIQTEFLNGLSDWFSEVF